MNDKEEIEAELALVGLFCDTADWAAKNGETAVKRAVASARVVKLEREMGELNAALENLDNKAA